MFSLLDWYRNNRETLEPLIFLTLFYGIARIAFPHRRLRGLCLALAAFLGFSFLEWTEQNHWELVRWGTYSAMLIYLVLYRTATNFSRNSKRNLTHQP